MTRHDVTADELRQDMETARTTDGRRLNSDGVDFELLAGVLRDPSRDVAGWEAPYVLPPLWHEPLWSRRGLDGTATFDCTSKRLRVLLSCSHELDGRAWLHLSVSHQKRIPNWDELVFAKEAFLGDREAYKVIPPRSRYVNINPFVLHLYALHDPAAAPALPDFTRGTGSI